MWDNDVKSYEKEKITYKTENLVSWDYNRDDFTCQPMFKLQRFKNSIPLLI